MVTIWEKMTIKQIKQTPKADAPSWVQILISTTINKRRKILLEFWCEELQYRLNEQHEDEVCLPLAECWHWCLILDLFKVGNIGLLILWRYPFKCSINLPYFSGMVRLFKSFTSAVPGGCFGTGCVYLLTTTREIHPLDPQPHRYCMLASTASAPRVTRCSLGLYWSRDLCSKHAPAGWGMSSYLGQVVRGSEIWWFMHSAHSLSTSLSNYHIARSSSEGPFS